MICTDGDGYEININIFSNHVSNRKRKVKKRNMLASNQSIFLKEINKQKSRVKFVIC